MKIFLHVLFLTIFQLGSGYVYAGNPSSGSCAWEKEDGTFWLHHFEKSIDLGTLYIPRDAPVGSIIGSDWVTMSIDTSQYTQLSCYNRAALSTSVPSGSVINNVIAANNRVPAGSIFSTNIPGVGIAFKTNTLKINAISGNHPYFPYTLRLGFLESYWVKSIPVSVLIIKTGEIAMGSQAMKVTSQVDVDGGGTIEKFFVNANIIRSECVLATSAKNIMVKMGSVSINDIKIPGADGAALQGFQIPLTDCISGSYPTVSNNLFTSSYVNLSLSGNSGSSILDASNGILGLNSKSTATGIAIQILQAGSNIPMSLGKSMQMKRVSDGGMTLDFNARYVKINDEPTAGSADASATFTISYK